MELNKERFERYLALGLCKGETDGDRACIVAAINAACGGDVSDTAESACVHPQLRRFAIRLNDSRWSSDAARSAGLRDLGYALPGTRDTIDGPRFVAKLAELTIRRVVPIALRAVGLEAYAKRCEKEGLVTAPAAAADASASYAADASASYADASASYAADAAAAAADSAAGAAASNLPLIESAKCALEAIEFARKGV